MEVLARTLLTTLGRRAPGGLDPCRPDHSGPQRIRPSPPARAHPSPLEVAAYHVHGEPIPAAEALGAEYRPFPVGGSWGPAVGHDLVPPPRHRPRRSGRGDRWPWASASGTPVRPGSAPSPSCGATVGPSRACHPTTVSTCSPRARWRAKPSSSSSRRPPTRPPPSAPTRGRCCYPNPQGAPLFTLQSADLHVRDPDFESFWHDFRVLVELLTELPETEPRFARCCAGLERACNLLELPDISGSWRRAQPVLTSLLDEPAAPGTHTVSIVGHAHLDTAWLWPLRETIRKCARTFSTVLELMDRYPEYRFVVSQAQHLAWMRDHYPDALGTDEGADRRGTPRAHREHVGRGRLQHPLGRVTRPPDRPRQALLPRRARDRDQRRVVARRLRLLAPRCPRSCAGAGSDWFLTQKLSWNQYNTLPHHSFLWEGIDGSRVFTHFPPADTYGGNVSVRELRFGVENFKDHDRATRSLYLFGWGDGGGGPTAEMLESARRLADLDGLPRLVMEGPRRFFTAGRGRDRGPRRLGG